MKDWQNDSASGGDNKSRNEEAWDILYRKGLVNETFESEKESEFINSLADRFEKFGDRTVVSSKQLFWLRDLKDKYLSA